MAESMERCAVEGCEDEGRRQVCPYDGRVHHHGRVHYPTDASARERWGSSLTFRPIRDDWFLMCDTHMEVLRQEVNRPRYERHKEATW